MTLAHATSTGSRLPDIAALIGRTTAEARPYQHRIIHKGLSSYLEKALRSVMIESPTGSGKTIMGLLIAKGLQTVFPDLEIGWISMRRNLLGQAEKENKLKNINARIKFISMFEKNLPPELLLTFPDGSKNPHAARRRMLIIDEAQHDAANSMASIHSRVQPQYILGMTATPFRTDHVKLCFDCVLKDAGLASLIKEGYLAQYRHFTVPRWNVREVCTHYLRSPETWGASIMYFHRIEECMNAATLLLHHGVAAEVVTGSSDRYAQIDRFMSGETSVLINCMVLTEGFDAPRLQTVFCRPSCKGVTIQMCGRAFRKYLNADGTPMLKQIVQAKKGWPFIKLATPAEQYVWKQDKDNPKVGDWLSLVVNPHINELTCKMLQALASTRCELPAFITNGMMKTRGRARRRRI